VAPEMCTLIRKREAALHLNRPYQLQQLGSHAISEATLLRQPCTCSMEVSGRLATPVPKAHARVRRLNVSQHIHIKSVAPDGTPREL
jgi:hypothetical protein